MAWEPTNDDWTAMAKAVVLWIGTARQSGYRAPDWLPTEDDISKSALFERIRQGKEPLPHAPPRGLACPWYALVEDPGPHFVGVGEGGHFGPMFAADAPKGWFGPDDVMVLQNRYQIVERRSGRDFILRDIHHAPETPYRFHLWYDPEWRHPSGDPFWSVGAWLMRNVEFEKG